MNGKRGSVGKFRKARAAACARMRTLVAVFLIVIAGAILAMAQTTGGQQQNLPDAPSAKKPAQQLPAAPAPQLPPPSAPARTTTPPKQEPQAAPPPAQPEPTPPPIQTVPQGGETPLPGSARDNLYKLVTNVNFVVVPVTVKSQSGRLVQSLTVKDFTVLEDDRPQKITFFTSDPFPLSAAVVIDEGMPDITFAKIRDTVAALVGAFGQFDEVSIYTYTNVVNKLQDFTAVGDNLTRAAQRLKDRRGEEGGGVPIVGGPMNTPYPTVNGRPIDPGAPITSTSSGMPYRRVSHVLNDAILQAAQDLAHRAADRRKAIFVISNGQESGSNASYAQVLKVLLSNQVQVYALGVGSAALPVYNQLEKIHIPGTSYANLLPKYVAATGGQMLDANSQGAIEKAYSRLTEEARNQYTIGYTTRATASSAYRSIEVRVDRPDLNVYAKYGYYPLPPQAPVH